MLVHHLQGEVGAGGEERLDLGERVVDAGAGELVDEGGGVTGARDQCVEQRDHISARLRLLINDWRLK